jgi:O-acetyl-ADP-ribose deacetylase (regulator of RNase III)
VIEEHAPGADILQSKARYLVNPVDCTGAQGKGLARAFGDRFPVDRNWFREIAQAGEVFPGGVYIRGYYAGRVVFLPTKRHWSEVSSLNDVRDGLLALESRLDDIAADMDVCGVAIPALGCGLGRLLWDDVRPLIVETAERLSARGVRVEVYPPHEGR